MLFLVFGTDYPLVTLGKVADYCPMCQQVRTFLIEDRYQRNWVMFPWGKGTFLDTHKYCKGCKREWICRKSDYPCMVPADEEIDKDDLLAETNPALAAQLRLLAEGAQPAADGICDLAQANAFQATNTQAQLQADREHQELLGELVQFDDGGTSYQRLRAKLDQWPRLTQDERAKVREKVTRFVATRHMEKFLTDIARTFPVYFPL